MTLVAAIEEKFNITIDTDDIVDFSSFKKGIDRKSMKLGFLFTFINLILLFPSALNLNFFCFIYITHTLNLYFFSYKVRH